MIHDDYIFIHLRMLQVQEERRADLGYLPDEAIQIKIAQLIQAYVSHRVSAVLEVVSMKTPHAVTVPTPMAGSVASFGSGGGGGGSSLPKTVSITPTSSWWTSFGVQSSGGFSVSPSSTTKK